MNASCAASSACAGPSPVLRAIRQIGRSAEPGARDPFCHPWLQPRHSRGCRSSVGFVTQSGIPSRTSTIDREPAHGARLLRPPRRAPGQKGTCPEPPGSSGRQGFHGDAGSQTEHQQAQPRREPRAVSRRCGGERSWARREASPPLRPRRRTPRKGVARPRADNRRVGGHQRKPNVSAIELAQPGLGRTLRRRRTRRSRGAAEFPNAGPR